MPRRWLFALLATTLAFAASAAEAPIPPAPTRWVTDAAGFLSPATRAELDARLEAVERATGHQVVVWIGDTIGDTPLDDWAVRTFAAWKVGRKGIDDGLAVFILATDRKIDIEVGYGLEGPVPDATAGRIIREVMTPRLRAGDKDGAVRAGVEALIQAIGAGDAGPGAIPAPQLRERGRSLPISQLILYGILGLGFLVFLITNPRLAMYFLWAIFSGGRGGGGGFGGGGGSSGGGGFSGGGGRSGGGGARGSW